MTKSIYIAGASLELDRAKAAIAGAKKLGYKIQLDWTPSVEASGADGPALTWNERLEIVNTDLLAARNADVFWMLVPRPELHTVGAWCELTSAFISDRDAPRLLSGRFSQTKEDDLPLFAEMRTHWFDTDLSALEWLRGYQMEF